MTPAERADIIVDFSQVKFGKSVTMINRGPDAPVCRRGLPARRSANDRPGHAVQRERGACRPRPFDATGPARHACRTVDPRRQRHAAQWPCSSRWLRRPAPPIPVEARLGTFDPAVGLPAGLTR